MKKLAFTLLAAVLFVSACKKDDDNASAASSFTINGSTIASSYGYIYTYGGDDGKELLFSDIAIVDTVTSQFSAVSIDLDTLIDGGSYTLLDKDSASYDKTKNFYDAFAIHKGDFVDGEWNDTTGTYYAEPKSGTLTIKKSGDNYTIGYSLLFPDNIKITGKYTGKLAIAQ